MLNSLTSLASLAGLDAVSAVALPTVITVAARKTGRTEAALVAEAMRNQPLRDYLAKICKEVLQ